MDIVQRIGQYFAQHEQQMNDVMKQALERSQSLVPAAPPVKPPRVIQGAFFSSRQPSTTTKPSSPSSLYQSEDVPDPPSPVTAVRKPPPSRLKPKRKTSSKKKPTRPTPTTTPEKEASTITKLTTAQKLQEAWRLTCERAKKIQTDQEAKLKETQELERHEKARRDSQLQQIETARRQAFAKPRPPSPTVPPKQLNVAEIWCEPRRAERKPRPQRPTVALRPAKPSKIPDESSRLAQPHSQSSDPISSNNVPAGPLLHAHLNPVTKFGPPPSSTPYLDELEARKRAMLLEQGTAVSKVREQLEQQRLAAKRQAEKDSMCRRREAHNAALATTVAQLQVEKEQLEQSLRSLQTEEADLRRERHRLTMERRAARRTAAGSIKRLETPEAIQSWVQEERVRAAEAKLARDRAKLRVQRHTAHAGGHGGPETSDDDVDDLQVEATGWHLSPLSSPCFQKALFTYSSSSSSDDNN